MLGRFRASLDCARVAKFAWCFPVAFNASPHTTKAQSCYFQQGAWQAASHCPKIACEVGIIYEAAAFLARTTLIFLASLQLQATIEVGRGDQDWEGHWQLLLHLVVKHSNSPIVVRFERASIFRIEMKPEIGALRDQAS
jgi:hypothetical protein